MPQTPASLQSTLLRQLCPLRLRTRSSSAATGSPKAPRSWTRSLASVPVAEDDIARLAAQPLQPLALSDLIKHGRPPLPTSALLSSAAFTLSLLPVRLAHRIHALRSLPFIVVSNPHISRIYSTYLESLSTLLPFQVHGIASTADEARFADVLADLVQTHANTIPVLARGFLESRKYIAPEAVTRFLDEHLRSRIGTRLIAEQHIALHLSSQLYDTEAGPPADAPSTYIGVIDTALRPASVLARCEAFVSELCELKYGVRPSVRIDGAADAAMAHIPTHLEYMLTELLKNAFRATVESGTEREPVQVTIAASRGLDGPKAVTTAQPGHAEGGGAGGRGIATDAHGAAHETVTIRIRDRGGGIAPEHLPHVWGYSFTTFNADTSSHPGAGAGSGPTSPALMSSSSSSSSPAPAVAALTDDALNTISATGVEGSTIAGLGYGLPLGRAYAEYFGGRIKVQSLWGWGTDVYLELRGLRGF